MKILVVTNMYPNKKMPFYGIFVKEQVESLRREGVSVEVSFINGRENRLNYFKSIGALVKKLKDNQYDIIHAHHTYCVYPTVLAKRLAGKRNPLILTFHEGEVHSANKSNDHGSDIIKRLVFSKRIKLLALNMVDQVICVQEDLKNALQFDGISQVLPCGVDIDLFEPLDKKWCRTKLKLPHNHPIVFFPASPKNTQKGFDILQDALKKLGRDDIYVLSGGEISHEEMPFYMCAADVIVQLSIFEASPMTLKEAMASNVPVVFTDVGDARSVIGRTEGCFLCNRRPDDVVLKLTEALACNGVSNGRTRILEVGLGLSEIAKKLITIYQNVLRQR